MPWKLILGLFVALVTLAASFEVMPRVLGRSIRTLFFLCIAAFCVFGFLASFEDPGITWWKIVYAKLGIDALAGAAFPWIVQPAQFPV